MRISDWSSDVCSSDLGQVHSIEMSVRHTIRDQMAALRPAWRAKLGPDHVHDAGVIGQISQTRPTGSTETLLRNEGLPDTFVPGRNLLLDRKSTRLNSSP